MHKQRHLDSSAVERASIKLCFPAPQSRSVPSAFQMPIFQLFLQSCEPPLILSINCFYFFLLKLATGFLVLCSQRTLSNKLKCPPPSSRQIPGIPSGRRHQPIPPFPPPPAHIYGDKCPSPMSVQHELISTWQWLGSVRRHLTTADPITGSLLGV